MQDTELPDPRVWPGTRAPAGAARLHAAALAAIAADTRQAAAIADAEATERLASLVAARDGASLAEALDCAPSFAVARHLWRLLADVERGDPRRATALRTTLAAMPVIFVSALDSREGEVTLPGILTDPRALEALLRDARELGGAQAFSLSSSLVGVDAIDVVTLPDHLAQ